MQTLWDWDRPASVREVVEHLQATRTIAYTTVLTVLDNLHGKNLVQRHKQGRAYLYAATLSREAHTASLLEQVLATSSNRGGALLHFVGQMSGEELAQVRAALAAHENQP